MKLPIIVKWDWLLNITSKLNGFKVGGVEYIPFVVVVRDLDDKTLINHETIHYYQMLETLVLGYYVIYIAHYLYLRTIYDHQTAYRMICLEKEAYANQSDLEYCKKRKHFAWLRS